MCGTQISEIVMFEEVLVRIGTVGLCGSDVHQWADGYIGEKVLTAPFVLGHEASGTVVEVGRLVADSAVQPGDRVALEPGLSCRSCEFCKNGRYNLCGNMRFFSTLQPPSDGALCQFKSHPADLCFKLPDSVSLDEGALIEPLSVAVHACTRAQLQSDSCALICGAGPIGVLCAMVCKSVGIADIVMTDVKDSRLECAKELVSACRTLNVSRLTNEQALCRIKQTCQPSSCIECTGVGASQSLAFHAVKPGGTVVLVGLGRPKAIFPVSQISVKEVTVRGIFRYTNSFPTAIDLVRRRVINLKSLVTNKFPLREAEKALMVALSGSGMKVLIHCSDSEQL